MSILQGSPEIPVQSLTKAGVVLAVSVFIVIIIYFTLSGPVDAMYDAFETANWGEYGEPHKTGYLTIIRNATTLFFAILLTIPIAWFFFWVFHREPNVFEMRRP